MSTAWPSTDNSLKENNEKSLTQFFSHLIAMEIKKTVLIKSQIGIGLHFP